MRCQFTMQEWRRQTGQRRFLLSAWKALSGLKKFTLKAWCDFVEQTDSTPSYVGPLDLVPGALWAASIPRAPSAASLGQSAFTLRRASGGEQAFSYDASTGLVDVAAVNTWAGGDAFFKILNDSVAAKNASQVTEAAQAGWNDDGLGGFPAASFGIGQLLITGSNLELFASGGISVFAVVLPVLVAGNYGGPFAGENGNFDNDNGQFYLSFGSLEGAAGHSLRTEGNTIDYVQGCGKFGLSDYARNLSAYLVEIHSEVAATTLKINNTVQGQASNRAYGAPPMTAFAQPFVVGADDAVSPSGYFDGLIAEIMVYPLLSAGDVAILRQNIAAYYGITL